MAGFAADPATARRRQLPPDRRCRTGCSRPPSSPRSSGSPNSAPVAEANLKIDKQLVGMRYSSLMSRKLRYAPLAHLPL